MTASLPSAQTSNRPPPLRTAQRDRDDRLGTSAP